MINLVEIQKNCICVTKLSRYIKKVTFKGNYALKCSNCNTILYEGLKDEIDIFFCVYCFSLIEINKTEIIDSNGVALILEPHANTHNITLIPSPLSWVMVFDLIPTLY